MNDRIDQLERLSKLKEQGALNQEQFDQEVQLLLKSSPNRIADNEGQVNSGTSMELIEGIEIGASNRKFRLIKKIGSGGMGQVWQARDLAEEAAYTEKGQKVKHRNKALKVVNASLMHSSVAIKQLQKEAMRAAELSHPNVINVNGWHKGTEGWLFIEMEFLQGHDLEEHLANYENGLSWKECQSIAQGIVEGLDYAHNQQQIIHRDLKPGNIFITDQNQIKILDFGLAYQLRKSRLSSSADSQSSGTTEYMPPEAFFANKPDSRYDIYAFSCLFYEMLTGQVPYSKEKATKRDSNEWPPQPDMLNDNAWIILQQGFTYEKEQRVSHIKDLWREIQQAQEKKGIKKECIEKQAVEIRKRVAKTKNASSSKIEKMTSSVRTNEEDRKNKAFWFSQEIDIGFYKVFRVVLISAIMSTLIAVPLLKPQLTSYVAAPFFFLIVGQFLWRNRKILSHFAMMYGLAVIGVSMIPPLLSIKALPGLVTCFFVLSLPGQYWIRYKNKIQFLPTFLILLLFMLFTLILSSIIINSTISFVTWMASILIVE